MRVPTCDCDACGGERRPSIVLAGEAARQFRFTAAPLTRRTLLGSALAAAAMALAPPAAAERAQTEQPLLAGPLWRAHAPRGSDARRAPPPACEAPPVLQWPQGATEHRLLLRNAATDEAFDGVIWRDCRFDHAALARLNVMMRDTHADSETECDVRLFELLACVQAHVGAPLIVLSGFRTPKTNAVLALSDSHVASNSFHMRGMAADICAPGVAPRELADTARAAGAGGIGLGATFVHLDTGPIRSWTY
jgi:uncharacterized protein YcbK (DUF882 family)